MQKAALALLPGLAPVNMPQLWGDHLQTLVNLLRPELMEEQAAWEPPAEPQKGALAKDLRRWATISLSMEHIVHSIADLFRCTC